VKPFWHRPVSSISVSPYKRKGGVYENDAAARGQVLVGSVLNENRKFGDYGRTSNPLWAGAAGRDRFRRLLASEYPPELVDEILALYPAADFTGNYYLASERVFDDQYWFCGARRTARWVASHGVPAFRYQWRHQPTNEPWGLGSPRW
jgi:hypothetical protein